MNVLGEYSKYVKAYKENNSKYLFYITDQLLDNKIFTDNTAAVKIHFHMLYVIRKGILKMLTRIKHGDSFLFSGTR